MLLLRTLQADRNQKQQSSMHASQLSHHVGPQFQGHIFSLWIPQIRPQLTLIALFQRCDCDMPGSSKIFHIITIELKIPLDFGQS